MRLDLIKSVELDAGENSRTIGCNGGCEPAIHKWYINRAAPLHRNDHHQEVMTLLTSFIVGIFSLVVLADEQQVVPKRYEPFQGKWRVISMKHYEEPQVEVMDVFVEVTGDKFELKGAGLPRAIRSYPEPFEFRIPESIQDNPYRELRNRGVEAVKDIVDVENQISVFWFVGIFRLREDRLELAGKYCGQGLEGFTLQELSSSFDIRRRTD